MRKNILVFIILELVFISIATVKYTLFVIKYNLFHNKLLKTIISDRVRLKLLNSIFYYVC